jgi:hypothetical protein
MLEIRRRDIHFQIQYTKALVTALSKTPAPRPNKDIHLLIDLLAHICQLLVNSMTQENLALARELDL